MSSSGGELSLTRMKTQAEARAADQERLETRKRNILVLIQSHLSSFGYSEACEKLQQESGVSLAKYSVADNIDLMSIVQEFEAFYLIKFGKAPKLIRKYGAGEKSDMVPKSIKSAKATPRTNSGNSKTIPKEGKKSLPSSTAALPPISKPSLPLQSTTLTNDHDQAGPSIEAIGTRTGNSMPKNNTIMLNNSTTAPAAEIPHEDKPYPSMISLQDPIQRLLKPLPMYESSELKDLAMSIQRDIFTQNPNVKWTDIQGLESSKRLIKEAIVFPIKYPHLFQGVLKPWKGILLYGPPGTGKTMLAKAVATECNTTFFNISASTVVSKWRGDSEKLIRVLFELARYHAPSTIFLDELESIMSHRGSSGDGMGGEHEGSRRMKTELLIQMDGLAKSNDHVFLLAASNLPWDLDLAMLRRLEKRILIDVPDRDARRGIILKHLPPETTTEIDYDAIAQTTQGYSGSDLNLVCREAAMRPLRGIFDKLDSSQDLDPAQQDELVATIRPVSHQDVLDAIACTKSSSDDSIRKKYKEWQHSFGSV